MQRQYSGTAGRIENCQLGVFLTYVSGKGRALIDRELYLPASWTADRDRCREAGIGEEVKFATKPELARRMLERARDAGAVFGWFTADEAYGDNPGLRAWLEGQDINYVMAISCDQRFSTPTGRMRADQLAAMAPKRGWQRLSAGQGSKGHRLYDWLLIDPGADAHQLLVRRSISKPTELAYYIVHTSTPVPLPELVRVAGSRWGVEETFQFTKNETGLDHYQVRKYHAWYRHITLSMLGRVPRRHRPHRAPPTGKRGTTTDHEQLIPLSCNEIRRLWATLTDPTHPRAHTDHWSRWRRRHQTRARACHYQRQHLKHHKMRL